MHTEIDKLISMALSDCKITDKEREIILRKAEKLGLDVDELEMYLENEIGKISLDLKPIDSIFPSSKNNESLMNDFALKTKFVDINDYNLFGFIEEFNNRLEYIDQNISNDFLNYTDNEFTNFISNNDLSKSEGTKYFGYISSYDLKQELSKKGGLFSKQSEIYQYKDEINSLLNINGNKFLKMYHIEAYSQIEYLLITKLGFWNCIGQQSKTIIYSDTKISELNPIPVSTYVNQLLYNFFRTSFNFSSILSKGKINLDFNSTLSYLNFWMNTENEKYISDLIKLNNHIQLLIEDYNHKIDKLILNKDVEFSETCYSDFIKEKWRNHKYNLYNIIDIFNNLLQNIKHILYLISYRNEMILCIENGSITMFMNLKNILEEKGIYLTLFEKTQIKSLDSINLQLQQLNQTLTNGFELIYSGINTLNDTIDSAQKNIVNEMKTSAIINSIQTYQLYKINKSLKPNKN
jgi:hypothetical protein